jgi:putative ATP-grasp target RiPP
MSECGGPLWRDPLFSPGDRFPLGPPRGIVENCHEGPSGPATRPFSLRHVVAGARLDTPPPWRYTYCHERQIALVYDEDGSLIPLLRHTRPGPTPSPGTSATPDGQPGKLPPEEMLPPDHQND